MITCVGIRNAAFGAALSFVGLATATAADAPTATAKKCLANETFDVRTGGCRPAEHTASMKAQKDKPYLTLSRKIPTSGTPFELQLVETRDEIYLPLGVRKPTGTGPFPAVIVASGNGIGGFAKIETAMYRLEPMMNEMLKRGYVVAFANYRNEIPQAYNRVDRAENMEDTISGGARTLKSTATLDSDDYIALIQHVQGLPYVRGKDVGTIGVSHAGELQAKAAAAITWGAGVLIEGASYEFIAVDTDKAPRKDGVMSLEDPTLVKSIADKPRAMERIRRMKTPFLHLGRDKDHLQGVFRTLYDWMVEAGVKESEWVSADHDTHGYGLLYRQEDGSYAPDALQKQNFDRWMGFFDTHLHNEAGLHNAPGGSR
jgi:dienelactone hydrolase